MAKKNPIRIRENRNEAEIFIAEYKKQYVGACEAVCRKLKVMGINEFPLSAVESAVVSGNYDPIYELFKPIIEAEKEKHESDILKADIEAKMQNQCSSLIASIPRLFQGVIKTHEFISHGINSVDEIKHFRERNVSIPMTNPSLFQFISLNEVQEPVLTDEAKRRILDLFADISNPNQDAIIEAQIQAAKFLTDLSDALIANGTRHDFEVVLSTARKFFKVTMDDAGRFTVSPRTEVSALL